MKPCLKSFALKIEINEKARKDLYSIPKQEAVKILNELGDLALFPNSKNVKKLTNFRPSYRKRIGNYRALFEIENNTVIVYRILHRKDVYK